MEREIEGGKRSWLVATLSQWLRRVKRERTYSQALSRGVQCGVAILCMAVFLLMAAPGSLHAHRYPDTVRVKVGESTTFSVVDDYDCKATVWIDHIEHADLATITPTEEFGIEVEFTVEAGQRAGVTTIVVQWKGEHVGEEEGHCREDTTLWGGVEIELRVTPDFVNSTGDSDDAEPGDGHCDTDNNIERDGREEPECTLRAAIQEAHTGSGGDQITFDIPGAAPHVIQPQSPLPQITVPVAVEGGPAAVVSMTADTDTFVDTHGLISDTLNNRVMIDGTHAGESVNGLEFVVDGASITGIAITNFGGNGVLAEGSIILSDVTLTNNTGRGLHAHSLKSVDGLLVASENGGDGIWVEGDLEVRRVNAHYNQGWGIRTDTGGIEIRRGGLSIIGNKRGGIYVGGEFIEGLDAGALIQVEHNGNEAEADAEGHGIYAPSAYINGAIDDLIASHNAATGVTARGVQVFGGQLTASQNGGDGIHVIEDLETSGITARFNEHWGVRVEEGTIRMHRSTLPIDISHNGSGGIYTGGDLVDAGVRSAVIENNGTKEPENGHGIYAPNAFVFLSNTRTAGNRGDGIRCLEIEMVNSWIMGNNGYGLLLMGEHMDVRLTHFIGNKLGGIYAPKLPESSSNPNDLKGSIFSQDSDVRLPQIFRIFGSAIENNQADGVRLNSDNPLLLHRTNLMGNSGFGVNNENPSVEVIARENWWGDASGPSGEGSGIGDAVSAGVDFSNWRANPVALVASLGAKRLYIPSGSRETTFASFRNWQHPNESISVTLSDERGWLQSAGSLTLELNEEIGAGTAIELSVPEGTPDGTTSRLTLTATSQTDPGDTVMETLEVVAGVRVDAPTGVLCAEFSTTGMVDIGVIQAVANRWRLHREAGDWDGRFDLDGDGAITIVDIMLVAEAWGQVCT